MPDCVDLFLLCKVCRLLDFPIWFVAFGSVWGLTCDFAEVFADAVSCRWPINSIHGTVIELRSVIVRSHSSAITEGSSSLSRFGGSLQTSSSDTILPSFRTQSAIRVTNTVAFCCHFR